VEGEWMAGGRGQIPEQGGGGWRQLVEDEFMTRAVGRLPPFPSHWGPQQVWGERHQEVHYAAQADGRKGGRRGH